MNEILHLMKHFVGFCGEHSHPSILLSGGVVITTIGIYWTKIINHVKDLL